MDVRPYQPADRDACLTVFDSNVPQFASAADRSELEHFLASSPSPFYVLEHDGAVIGCGGFAAEPPGARLTWGMIRRDLQRQGLGRYLLMYRMRELARIDGIATLAVETTPAVAGFFERQGFRLIAQHPGRVELQKKLTVCP